MWDFNWILVWWQRCSLKECLWNTSVWFNRSLNLVMFSRRCAQTCSVLRGVSARLHGSSSVSRVWRTFWCRCVFKAVVSKRRPAAPLSEKTQTVDPSGRRGERQRSMIDWHLGREQDVPVDLHHLRPSVSLSVFELPLICPFSSPLFSLDLLF